jgi:NAD(P)-dependent dehydrogenase (short-subunit alcohol dehydrogenase family)
MAEKLSVVVTGASTGIGYGIAKVLLGKGFRVFGSVRRQEDADRVTAELGSAFTALLMDVTDAEAVRRCAGEVGEQLGSSTLAGLVNNAGVAVGGPLLHLPADEFRRQLEVNLLGPFSVTQAFAPLLGADRSRQGRPGRIVNISSVAGKTAFPFIGAYAASKHALEAMSESLRRELLLYGIDVIVVGPGAVVTPIIDKAEAADTGEYDHTDYAESLRKFRTFFMAELRKGLAPDVIGESVYTALTTARPRVRYAVVPQRFKNWTLPRLLPKRVLDRAIGKQLGFIGGGKG